MKLLLPSLTILGTALALTACSHSGKNYHQGYCHQLSTQINSYQHSGLSRAQSNLNAATRSQLTQQYQAYGCHD